MKDNIDKAMKSGEITLSVFVDFSKAFNTIDLNILIQKLHNLPLSETFLYLYLDYLSNRTQFVQIGSSYYFVLHSNLVVLQGSILGLVLFNLCVADMNDFLPNCTSLQHADNSTIYQHCSVTDLKTCSINVERNLSRLLNWSTDNNLDFNPTKTKLMLLTTAQMKD